MRPKTKTVFDLNVRFADGNETTLDVFIKEQDAYAKMAWLAKADLYPKRSYKLLVCPRIVELDNASY